MRIISDATIQKLLDEPKTILPSQISDLKNKRRRKGRKSEATVVIQGKMHRFSLIASDHASKWNTNKFSVILCITWYRRRFNLIRCNGWHDPHTNEYEKAHGGGIIKIPKNTCHIHYATERYQFLTGSDPIEGYAEPTDEYHNIESAIDFMCDSFGFVVAGNRYTSCYPLFRMNK